MEINPNSVNKPCKCCGGTGIQHNTKTGLTVLCPCCGGTGEADKPTITWQR